MKLLYIFPRTTVDATERTAEHARRRGILQSAASLGTHVDIRELEGCPPAIESLCDAYAVAPHIIAMAQRFEEQYDGMIVGCFGDPAVDAAIEVTRIPIVGCGVSSMVVALLLGQRFAILSPGDRPSAHLRPMLMAAGLLDRYAGAVGVGIGVTGFAVDRAHTLEAVTRAGVRALELGADVLLIGCLSLAFTDVGDALQERLGVPVVNPVRVALGTCEMLVSARLTPYRPDRAAACSSRTTAHAASVEVSK